MNPRRNEYAHYFRETEHADIDEKELLGFFRREKTIIPPSGWNYESYVKSKFPDWFVGKKPYFKKGSTLDLLDQGVSRGKVKEFLEHCVDGGAEREKIGKQVDLVLFGHVHNQVEYRLEWDDQQETMLYYMDFYTYNPEEYYSSRKYQYDRSLKVIPDISATSAEVDEAAEEVCVPPYAKPLNESDQPKAWWDDHRPLLLQTAPLGPKDNLFHGCRLVYVTDDVIQKIHHIPVNDLRQDTDSYSVPAGGPPLTNEVPAGPGNNWTTPPPSGIFDWLGRIRKWFR